MNLKTSICENAFNIQTYKMVSIFPPIIFYDFFTGDQQKSLKASKVDTGNEWSSEITTRHTSFSWAVLGAPKQQELLHRIHSLNLSARREGKTYLILNAICCVSFILCNTYRCNDIHMSLSIFIKKIFNICGSIEYSMH